MPAEIRQTSPVGNQPSEESEEEIVELEAIGDAPSIPVQPLTPIQAIPVATDPTSTAPEYELVIRWDTPCSACQAHVVVYQQDIGQTVQCGKCSQPITVTARQPLPLPERVIKQPHRFAGEQTRIAQLSERQPQPKKEVLYRFAEQEFPPRRRTLDKKRYALIALRCIPSKLRLRCRNR